MSVMLFFTKDFMLGSRLELSSSVATTNIGRACLVSVASVEPPPPKGKKYKRKKEKPHDVGWCRDSGNVVVESLGVF